MKWAIPGTPAALQRGLLSFWACWWSVVVLSNATELLVVFGALPADFGWTSGNHALMVGDAAGTPMETVITVVFLLGLCWEVLAAGLMWKAARWRGDAAERAVAWRRAFFVALAFWAVFLGLDEVALVHKTVGTPVMHLMAMVLHLASLTVIEVLEQARP